MTKSHLCHLPPQLAVEVSAQSCPRTLCSDSCRRGPSSTAPSLPALQLLQEVHCACASLRLLSAAVTPPLKPPQDHAGDSMLLLWRQICFYAHPTSPQPCGGASAPAPAEPAPGGAQHPHTCSHGPRLPCFRAASRCGRGPHLQCKMGLLSPYLLHRRAGAGPLGYSPPGSSGKWWASPAEPILPCYLCPVTCLVGALSFVHWTGSRSDNNSQAQGPW